VNRQLKSTGKEHLKLFNVSNDLAVGDKSTLLSVRSEGLLGLRPSELAATACWDWAGVTGRWFGVKSWNSFSDSFFAEIPYRIMSPSYAPGFVTFTAVRHPDDIVHAMRNFGLQEDRARADWDKVVRELPLRESGGLPPVYFHGVAEPRVHPLGFRPDRLLAYGVVQLTDDSPPQLQWTMSISVTGRPFGTGPGGADPRLVFSGIQVGGRGATKGILGVSFGAEARYSVILLISHRNGSIRPRKGSGRSQGHCSRQVCGGTLWPLPLLTMADGWTDVRLQNALAAQNNAA
jgi:hypothetical protein